MIQLADTGIPSLCRDELWLLEIIIIDKDLRSDAFIPRLLFIIKVLDLFLPPKRGGLQIRDNSASQLAGSQGLSVPNLPL